MTLLAAFNTNKTHLSILPKLYLKAIKVKKKKLQKKVGKKQDDDAMIMV